VRISPKCRDRGRPLERIIVGHDLGSGGAAALESALVLTRRCEAAIRVIHVIQPHPHSQDTARSKTRHSKVEERAAKAGGDLELIIEKRIDCRRRMDYEVRVGNPFFELILAGCAWHADLIVVGGPDRQPFHLLGGTAEGLARKAPIPVLVTPKPLNCMAKRFLVPTDFSTGARQAAETGINLAKRFGGRIFFFHAFDPTPWYSYPCDDETLGLVTLPELTKDDVEDDWASFLGSLPKTSIPWQTRTEEGRAADTILSYAEAIDADLTVMGTHGRTGLEYLLLGSVSESVVRRASRPVLVVRPEALSFRFS
jgi:nucleotide-binding universal stress UspA family protein